MDTTVLALGIVLLCLGFALWAYKKLHRVAAWFMGAGAFVLTVGVTPLHDALAQLFGTPTGLVFLTGLTVISIICFAFEAVAKHKHHRIRTPVIAATLGVTLVLAIADASAMLSSLGKSTSNTGSALSVAVKHIHSGAAAHAYSKDHAYAIVALAIGVVVALVVLGIRMDKAKSKGAVAAAGRPAIPGALRALTGGTSGKARR